MSKLSRKKDLVEVLVGMGNSDHPNFKRVDKLGRQKGLSKWDSREAMLVAREKRDLRDNEILEGGSGNVAKNTGYKSLADLVLSPGEVKG